MISIIVGSFVLSVLHAVIPNHWLPVVAIAKKESWTLGETLQVTFVSGLAHAVSTVLIGIMISLVGLQISKQIEAFTTWVEPLMLVALGLFFIIQHHRHQHFSLHQSQAKKTKRQVVISLLVAMFLSPCFEIEAYFLLAGAEGWWLVVLIAVLYLIVTVTGMLIWVRIVYTSLLKLNWHAIEHNAGLITGGTLILTGVALFFIH